MDAADQVDPGLPLLARIEAVRARWATPPDVDRETTDPPIPAKEGYDKLNITRTWQFLPGDILRNTE